MASFFANSNASYADNISNGIEKIGAIINSKSLLSEKESKVEPIVKSLMNYDKFFNHIAGKGFWSSLSADEKSKIIDQNNKGYIKDYFNKITECNTFSVKEIGDSSKQKRLFSYTCNNETKKLDVITIGGKVLDVQIAGVSFIQTEKAKLTNLNSDEEKKKALLGKNK
jgi:hypothetical protein